MVGASLGHLSRPLKWSKSNLVEASILYAVKSTLKVTVCYARLKKPLKALDTLQDFLFVTAHMSSFARTIARRRIHLDRICNKNNQTPLINLFVSTVRFDFS